MNTSKSEVLIVDDESVNLVLISELLTESYTIHQANDGSQALQLLTKIKPDLILLDIMMPGIDGYEVCQRIQSNPLTKNIPIIFLTAKTEYSDIVKGFECGGVDYITKPFNMEELSARVSTHIQLKKAKEEIENKNRELEIAHKKKDKVFSIVSYNLKDNLSELVHLLDFIAYDKNSTQDKLEILKTSLGDASHNTKDLLENLILWSKIHMKSIHFCTSEVLFSDIISGVQHYATPRCKAKSISLEFQCHHKQPLNADKTLLLVILQNLLSNAIKFSSVGGTIYISMQKASEDGFALISVKDQGTGMDETRKKNLFQLEVNNSQHTSNPDVGSGLGLILCKEFIKKHGGQIYLESNSGKGSNFYFTIPLYQP